MALLDKLEQKFSWITIEHLPIYVVSAQSVLYLWGLINPESRTWMTLDPVAVHVNHEYWRLLTFLFVTPTQNALFAFFFLYLLYVYGMAPEELWGSFQFTIFYLTGAICTGLAGLLFGSMDGAFFLNTTLFLAFAALNPNFTLYFFFVLPIKVKWIAVITWLYFGYMFVVYPIQVKAAIFMSLLNYLLFFSKSHWDWVAQQIRSYQHRRRFKDWPTS